jgi:phosphoribosylaminoimidazolecarboxamide formyltransferase / IMP cyclohydrolase
MHVILVGEMFPPSFTVPLELKSTLRYGENPHQSAAFYADKSLSLVGAGGIATAIQHHGKVKFCMTRFGYLSS